MRGLMAIALLFLLTDSLCAQMRGGMRGAASGVRSGAVARGTVNRGVFVSSGTRHGVVIRSGSRRPFHSRFHRRFAMAYPWWGYGYLPYYGDYGYEETSYQSERYPAAITAEADARDRELRDELEDLRVEVARLNGALEARQTPPVPARTTASKPTPATVLMFRDGTKQEVDNYAIVGQTLWVFSQQRARKIPMSSLDVDATTKINDARGLRFQAPR